MTTPDPASVSGFVRPGFITLLPMRVDETLIISNLVIVQSPWGAPLLMGAQGASQNGDPVLILINESPVNFLRPMRPLDELDKWQLELIHIQRAAVDARLSGIELFHAVEKGGDPPDALVHIGESRHGWELTTFSVQRRRMAQDLFARVRAKLSFQQRHRVSHLTSHMIYMWFGMEGDAAGIPYARNDEDSVDQLVEALVRYQPQPKDYTVESKDGMPLQLPEGFGPVRAPGDVSFFCVPFINSAPASPLFTMTGFEVGLAYQSVHTASSEWDRLRSAIHRKDKPGNDVLLISAGAPDRFGSQYPAEEVLASFLLDHPEPFACSHLSAVILHFWSSGRAVNLLGEVPLEAWPPIYQGLSPAFQPFRTTDAVTLSADDEDDAGSLPN